MINRGFPHLPLIKTCVRQLYRHLSPSVIRSFSSSYNATRNEVPSGDAIIATQHIARRIAALYQLQVGAIVVSFVSHLKGPGQIELSNSNDFFVELNSEHRYNHREVAAILAHEVAHIFCHKHDIAVGGTFENEVLTDSVAAYLGAGVPILNAFTEEADFMAKEPNRMRQQCFGYITPDEFGYLLAKRQAAFGEDPTANLTSKKAVEAFTAGRARAQQELQCPPLRSAGLGRRLLYNARRSSAAGVRRDTGKSSDRQPIRRIGYEFEFTRVNCVVFECPICFQRLRVPTHQKSIAVKCSVCETRSVCRT